MSSHHHRIPYRSTSSAPNETQYNKTVTLKRDKTHSEYSHWLLFFGFTLSLLFLAPGKVNALSLDISPASVTASEGDGPIIGGVRLIRESGDSQDACSISGFITLGGSATFNSDYDFGGEGLDFQIDLPANASSAEDPGGVVIIDDSAVEETETIILTISDSSITRVNCTTNLAINNNANTIITIQDNDTTAATAVDDTASTTTNTPVTIDVLSNDAGSGISVTSLTTASHGTVIDNGDGTLTYTPDPDFAGTDSFTYTITDGQSGQDTATVTITTTAPTLVAVDDSASTTLNQPVTINLLTNDQGSGLVISSVGTPSNGAVQNNGNGSITYTPNTGFDGTDSFSYTITDASDNSATASVTIDVTTIIPTINAVDDSVTTDVDQAITIDVLVNDEGSGLTISNLGNPTNGTVVDNGNGTLTYTPNTGFEGLDSFSYTLVDSTDSSDTATVTVSVGGTNFGELPSLDDNQQSIADSLDTLCLTAQSGELQSQCSTISSLPTAQQIKVLDELAPNDLAAQGSVSVEIATTQISNIRTRLASLRNGASGLAMGGVTVNLAGQSIPLGSLADTLVSASERGGASGDEERRFGVFVNGRINFGDKEATANESGFDFDTRGITIGADYRLNDQLILGGAFGVATTDSEFENSAGDLDNRTATLSLYGNIYPSEQSYVDWILSAGKHQYETSRNLTTLSTGTEGDTDGDEISLSLSGGMNLNYNSLLLNAYGRLEYIKIDIDGYQESGGDGLALQYEDQTIKSLTTALGARLSNTYSLSWGVLTPSFYLEWEHEFEDDGRLITAAFSEDPSTSFSVATDSADQDYLNYGIGLVATLSHGKSLFFNYESVAGQDGVENTTIDLGIRIEF